MSLLVSVSWTISPHDHIRTENTFVSLRQKIINAIKIRKSNRSNIDIK